MRVLLSNVRVTDEDGNKVVLFGGTVVPEWAKVPASLAREVADVGESADYGPQTEVSHGDGSVTSYAHQAVDSDDGEPRYEGDWYGAERL